jgi:GTP-binding protein HflX
MFDLHDAPARESRDVPTRALVVCVDLGNADFAAHADEFHLLVEGAGAQIVGTVLARRQRPDPALFVGTGKAQEIAARIEASGAELVLFDQALAPAQQRNLERALKARVVDRVMLILDIFALRAASHEGKLQVELAQLQHLSTRLVRGWTHLERQRGGIGLRGPGETQLETDRRLIGQRMKLLRERLDRVVRQRQTQRRSRSRSGAFMVSLVGYTNAGKSTLFNALTRAGAYAADQLFATLDTTTRRIWIDGAGQITLSDTVGFIRDLPTPLIAAFRATLEETLQADLLLHVIDAANPQRDEQQAEVERVLREIGADSVPVLRAFNKIDLTGLEPGIRRNADGIVDWVGVSAVERRGLDELRQAIAEAAVRPAAEPVAELDPRFDAPTSGFVAPSIGSV